MWQRFSLPHAYADACGEVLWRTARRRTLVTMPWSGSGCARVVARMISKIVFSLYPSLPPYHILFHCVTQRGPTGWCTATVTTVEAENVIPKQLSPEVLSAIQAVRFIAQHIKDADKDNEVSNHASPHCMCVCVSLFVQSWSLWSEK